MENIGKSDISSRFREELIETGIIHAPLPLHEEFSLEEENKNKKVLDSKELPWDMNFRLDGIGTVELKEDPVTGEKQLALSMPSSVSAFKQDVDYEHRSESRAFLRFPFQWEDWSGYTRLRLSVLADCPGAHSVHCRLHLANEGTRKIPDVYNREGQSLINLHNHQWNVVIWEFSSLPRDRVTELSVTIDADGKDTSTGDEFHFVFREFELQTVENPQKEMGWDCDRGHIAYSMAGYDSRYVKTAVAGPEIAKFELVKIKESGEEEIALGHSAEKKMFAGSEFSIFDFSEIQEQGTYYIRGYIRPQEEEKTKSGDAVKELHTEVFRIADDILSEPVYKLINFVFCERCGYPIPGKHGKCHTDVTATHDGKTFSFGGGWHDAGDMSQQMLQTAEVAQELLELSDHVKDRDPLLASRLREEGLWGLEFTLQSRFGDGYRASSVGLGCWTDCFIGDEDDITARVHNQAYQNYFCGAVEAEASFILKSFDADLSWKCLEDAREDYHLAKARFEEKGIELPSMWEHTYNSGMSQYYAAALWAASSICRMDPSEEWKDETIRLADRLCACQETGTDGVPLKGFFYRDETHRTIVHFSHQSREHSFVQALASALRALPQVPEKAKWEKSLALYGDYMKAIYAKASPYGMLPAGIYHVSEADDEETFNLIHLQSDYKAERGNYIEQLQKGLKLGGGYYLRQFPVWFSFRGNNAILLAEAKAAGIVGRYFGDRELLNIAAEQFYWVLGKNPFCQSLMYGEGYRYGEQDSNYPGTMTGEVPVGIETDRNEDVPYWPSGTNATYKEVWLTPAGRLFSVASEL